MKSGFRSSLWSMRCIARLAPVLTALALSQTSLHAHHLPPGFEEIDEFEHGHAMLSGFQHPLTGWDHCLALVAIGAAAALSFRRKALLPAAYVAGLLAGGWMTLEGLAFPQEPLLTSAVLMLAVAVMWLPRNALQSLVGAVTLAFGMWQGAQHVAWVAVPRFLTSYAVGFAASGLVLMLVGGSLAVMAQRLPQRMNKMAGAALVAAGFVSAVIHLA